MINNLLAVLIYGLYLVVPGYLFLVISSIKENRFLLSYGISITLIVVTLLPFSTLETSILLWLGALHISIIFLLIGAILFRKRNPIHRLVNQQFANISLNMWSVGGCLLLLFSFTLYHLAVGAYTEIPSDFWKHLARVGNEFSSLRNGTLGQNNTVGFLLADSSPVYVMHSVVAYLLSASPIQLTPSVTLVTGAIFLASIYWFCLKLLTPFNLDHRLTVIGSLLAAFLTLVTFGTASFSYVRYYAYFPTILGFPLIYASIALFLDYLEQPDNRGRQLTLIPVFIAVMALIHHQEALLTCIMLAGIAIIRGLRSIFPASHLSDVLALRARLSAQWCFVLVVIIAIYSFYARPLGTFGPTPFAIDAGRFFPPLKGILIDNPSFRFWDTLGFFGIIVYVWYLFKWKSIRRLDFLTVGMLTPLLTNFNPLYTTLFLRYGSPSGIWRTAYLMPLSITAAILIVLTCSNIVTAKHRWRRTTGFVMITLLILSQIPLDLEGLHNRTSRIPSLMSVNNQSGAGLWRDLIGAVEQIQKNRLVRRIVTDETSKFVLYAATNGRMWPWTDHTYFPKHKLDYEEDFLESDFNHSLLVINKRNGYQTISAKHAGHWPPDILNISRHYPNNIDEFVSRNSEYFQLLWSADDIKIYMMSWAQN